MKIDIDKLIDKLVPRGGNKPKTIQTSLEEYLSRLSNLNRKLKGLQYRKRQWNELCKSHKEQFDKQVSKMSDVDIQKNNFKSLLITYSLRDTSIENEFEILLYSMASTLSTLTRLIVCFLKGSTQVHSHTSLNKLLVKYQKFKDLSIIVDKASTSWAKDLTARRDAATHYIALGVTSSLVRSKGEKTSKIINSTTIGIMKTSEKYSSLWDDELPTKGGSTNKSIRYCTGMEIHELMDFEGNLVVKRETPVPKKPELINGEEYLQTLQANFDTYVADVLGLLITRLDDNSS